MSTKSGPLGQAILTSVTELTLLPQTLLDRVVGGVKLGKSHRCFDGWPFRRSELGKYMGDYLSA